MCLGSTAWQWFQRSFGENSKGQEKLQEKVIQHSEPFIDSKYILNTFYGQGAVWEFMETTMKIQPKRPVLTEPSLQLQQVRVTVPCKDRQVNKKGWSWTISHWSELPDLPVFMVMFLAAAECTLAQEAIPACQNWSCSWSRRLHVFSRDHMKIYEWKTCIPKSRKGRDWFVGLEQPIDGVEGATVGRAFCQTTHRQGTDMLTANKDVLKSQERNCVGIWPRNEKRLAF